MTNAISLIEELPPPIRTKADLPAGPAELRPLRIGDLEIGFPVVQAALSGYSDGPMRIVARRLGVPYTLAEVMIDRFVVDLKNRRCATARFDYNANMRLRESPLFLDRFRRGGGGGGGNAARVLACAGRHKAFLQLIPTNVV